MNIDEDATPTRDDQLIAWANGQSPKVWKRLFAVENPLVQSLLAVPVAFTGDEQQDLDRGFFPGGIHELIMRHDGPTLFSGRGPKVETGCEVPGSDEGSDSTDDEAVSRP